MNFSSSASVPHHRCKLGNVRLGLFHTSPAGSRLSSCFMTRFSCNGEHIQYMLPLQVHCRVEFQTWRSKPRLVRVCGAAGFLSSRIVHYGVFSAVCALGSLSLGLHLHLCRLLQCRRVLSMLARVGRSKPYHRPARTDLAMIVVCLCPSATAIYSSFRPPGACKSHRWHSFGWGGGSSVATASFFKNIASEK